MIDRSLDFFNENVQRNVSFLSVLSVIEMKTSICNPSFSVWECQTFLSCGESFSSVCEYQSFRSPSEHQHSHDQTGDPLPVEELDGWKANYI